MEIVIPNCYVQGSGVLGIEDVGICRINEIEINLLVSNVVDRGGDQSGKICYLLLF